MKAEAQDDIKVISCFSGVLVRFTSGWKRRSEVIAFKEA